MPKCKELGQPAFIWKPDLKTQRKPHAMASSFRLFGAMHTGIYRLSGGRLGGRMFNFKLLLLTTVGRRNGRAHTVPLGYFEEPGGYLVVASNGGQPRHPAWYHNLLNQPEVKVQELHRHFLATAEVLGAEARTRAWQHVIASAPIYATYEKKTTRQIPLVLLRPHS
jgi:deazaflavin-dependent oxidoreductase (nitroreductase family)